MSNAKTKQYEFESTFVPYSKSKIFVTYSSNDCRFVFDDVLNIINFEDETLTRENKEMIMVFDFKNQQGYVELLDADVSFDFEITTYELNRIEEAIELNFKYILEEEVYISFKIS